VATLIIDPQLERRVRAERTATGADRYDEVWEGTYMMAPMPNDEHQELVMRFGSIFEQVIGWPGRGKVRPGINVSDRKEGWELNYRVPDVAVFLAGGKAENCSTFWFGGPDFVIEIVSPGDRTLDKLPFYEAVGVRECLVIDRAPWRLVLYRLDGQRLVAAAESTLAHSEVLESEVLPFTLRLIPGGDRPQIEVIHEDDGRRWVV
jgi:Uma2 family endonuclease